MNLVLFFRVDHEKGVVVANHSLEVGIPTSSFPNLQATLLVRQLIHRHDSNPIPRF